MPAEWNEGMIYLIPKLEGVVDDIKKWRPITLLNTVYKVYAKLLATRLQPFLPHIVHKTQTGFIQERSIFDNIFIVLGDDINSTINKTRLNNIAFGF